MKITDLSTLQYISDVIVVNGVACRMATVAMYEFANIPDHKTWAEETRIGDRLGKERGKHLKNFSPTQLNVAIAAHADGTIERLDGNSRAYFYRNGLMSNIRDTQTLFVSVFQVRDQHQSIDLFKTYDSKQAVDVPNDILAYAYHELEMKVHSNILSSGATQAIKTAYKLYNGKAFPKSKPISAAIEMLRSGIEKLDTLDVHGRSKVNHRLKKHAGAIAAYIALAQRYGHIGIEGIEKYLRMTSNTSQLDLKEKAGGTATDGIANFTYTTIEALLLDEGLINPKK